ncbi:MAG: WD40 repeat domain-containing protein [Verrucomicrobia bacterium]|nr:WD40 repeat domain-containing protein [Verrucomicrobiota bacterium]
MRCLEKDRARRYESAAALASDVQRHLANEPVIARPPSAAYTLQKLMRRHRVAFASAAAIAAVLVIGAVVSTWQAVRATRAEHEQSRLRVAADSARAREFVLRGIAETQELATRRRAYAADINLVQQSLANDNLGRARELLYRHRPRPGESDLRGWEWRYLWQFCQSDAQSVLKEADGNAILSVATSADRKWAALGSRDGGQLLICNLQTREEIRVPAGRDGGVRAAFSPREPLVAIATADPFFRDPLRIAEAAASPSTHRVLLWDLNTRQVLRELSIVGTCSGLAFSDDGETLVIGSGVAVAGTTGEISIWRTADGSKVAGWAAGHTTTGTGNSWFAAARDAAAAAIVTAPNRIGVIDLKSGRERWSIVASDNQITCLAFSPDGRVLAAGAGPVDSTISLWDAGSGQPLGRLIGQRGATSGIEFLADGKHLVSSSWDQTLRLWDLASRTTVRTFRGHKTEVHALALARDQRTLISGCKDGSAYVWDLNADRNVSSSGSLGAGKKAWGLAGDGESMVTLDANGRLARRHGRAFQVETTLVELGPVAGFEPRQIRVLLDPQRPLLAMMTKAGKLQAWDWERRTLLREWDRPAGIGFVTPIRFSVDGTKLVVIFDGAGGGSCRELEIDTGRETRSFNFPDRSVAASELAPIVSPDGRQLIMVFPGAGETTRFDLASGRFTTHRLKVSEVSFGTRFSPDGRFLAVPSMLGYARILDAASYQEVATLSGLMGGVHSAAYSPDMQRLAIGSTGEEAVTLWDAHNFERLLNLGSRAGAVAPVAFSPDGNVIAGQSNYALEGTIHFWRAPSWAEIEAAEKRAGDSAK